LQAGEGNQDVVKTFAAMREEVESHMVKEENVLFPAIRILETQDAARTFLLAALPTRSA
jgi:iron-sulfur cluster repair protein YtfE (RIC family)